MPWSTSRCAALSAVVFAVTAAQANQYTITDLGEGREPAAINNELGDIAGRKVNGDVESAVIRRADNGRHARWHTLSARDAFATTIDAQDDVAGAREGVPTLWRGDTGDTVRIRMPDNFAEGYVSSVYGFGQPTTLWQVWGTYTATDGTSHCFRGYGYADGIDVNDDFPWQGDSCVANGNSNYKTYGGANSRPGGPIEAFMWDDGGPTKKLGTLPGGHPPYSMAMGGNEKREFVGCSSTPQGLHAFYYRRESMVDIGASPDYPGGTCAYAIDEHGQEIVGTGYDAAGLPHAVRFADGDVIALDSEVVNLGNWVLQKAAAINRRGIIVGEGTIDGVMHGFMLKPN